MQILGSGESTAKKKASSKSLSRVLEALRRYSEAGKVLLKNKRHRRVLEGAAQILGSGKSTAKKKASSKSLSRVLEALRRYSEAGKVRLK